MDLKTQGHQLCSMPDPYHELAVGIPPRLPLHVLQGPEPTNVIFRSHFCINAGFYTRIWYASVCRISISRHIGLSHYTPLFLWKWSTQSPATKRKIEEVLTQIGSLIFGRIYKLLSCESLDLLEVYQRSSHQEQFCLI